MRFGFDIDDTLINLREHAFHLYNKKLNKEIGLELFHALEKVEIHEPFGLTNEEGKEMWNSTLEEIYYTSCPAFPGAVELLQQLKRQGHEIFYITARPKEHGERTKTWMIERGFPVHPGRFYYGMQDTEKVDIIRKLKLDYYFDDKPDVLNTLENEPSLQIYVKDQSYNKHLNVPRVIDWNEFRQNF
ncbi:HAD family acid phosphatase [Bacillus sp. B15-48]|uniref:5' nucleotidase, NT5C type n=1 Tax=Bacillus sp. B15-48 TaxID=1548601 RepID=UPI00193FA22A|nr:HAD family acid phosphatase [Bacillus sp. B15-48]MBM4760939.1 HAD hydrolase-like protein [Bacillus sp. B15-48]